MADTIDPTQVTPDEFAQLVKSASDDEVLSTIRSAGTKDVLDRIFQGMQERFLPEKAQGNEATVQWVVTDEGSEYPYVTDIKNGTCEVREGTAPDPRVELNTDLLSFIKLITGQAQGPQLFMSQKLKIKGDLMFSAKITSFFDTPK